ncbi:MAG: aminotransferase class V-fold PLP-dependent enzyme, partial [Spirochaetia bacterium]|nr:aminotransferase class V-fold PLP-dependent enzyme [Spirochaetia bacterium]
MVSIYFDWAATAPILPELPQLISEALLNFQSNPSSIHSSGKKSKLELENSRNVCANLLDIKPEQLIFTSGGTESNSIIFSSLFLKKPGSHIILSAIEHPSVYEFTTNLKSFGFEIDFIKPSSNGLIIPGHIEKLLKKNTTFVSIMTVNNETGAIQQINEIGLIIRNFEQKNGRQIHFHTDAVQALGKIPFKPELLNIDSASFSAHKIGGPKGVGMLYIKKPLNVLSTGGGQEFSIRPGTENTAGIIAFSRAMESSLGKLNENYKHVQSLKTIIIT